LAVFAVSLGHEELGVGAFDGVLEEAAFEHLAAAFDTRFEVLGEISILRGHGQFQADLSLKDEALVLDLDCLGGDCSLKLLGSTHGDVLRWCGGVAMRALLATPPQILQIRAQTGDRQEKPGNFETVATLPGGIGMVHAIRLGIEPFVELGGQLGVI
jgi:hypothetical protein